MTKPCPSCQLHGMLNCRETTGICDKCHQYGDVFMDYSKSGDREKPDQTLCLDCLDKGEHFTYQIGFDSYAGIIAGGLSLDTVRHLAAGLGTDLYALGARAAIEALAGKTVGA